ncbi:hypothetical protein [Pseudenterobacter timonensis]|uniref:hypothetical protein n=1 Tax=Pseudenterobacter timonensis TaxID=1755099 RepID=UPI0011DE09E7|nr:hypothetical protein [Pseudenterobacter timonensis]
MADGNFHGFHKHKYPFRGEKAPDRISVLPNEGVRSESSDRQTSVKADRVWFYCCPAVSLRELHRIVRLEREGDKRTGMRAAVEMIVMSGPFREENLRNDGTFFPVVQGAVGAFIIHY